MSYSSIIRESEDLGAGLFDTEFNTLCESDSTPMHIGSIPGYLRGIERVVQGNWKPGDIVIHNHPYHGASHVPDICCVAPVFYKDELVGFSANTAHHVDLGAATPGIVIDIPDVFAEGMLFDGLKLYQAGKRNRALWQYIETNTRVPRDVLGDIEAQVASAELGVRRFQELFATYGKDVVRQASRDLMNYSEQMLRRRIAEIPDGEYVAEGFLDDDGVNRDTRLPVKVTVRIEGDAAEVDTTGSADQVPTAYNVPFEGSTKVTCYFAFRALLLDTWTTDEYVPQNEGSFRPINVVSPEGSIFNPEFPAPCQSRFSQCQRLVDLIAKALAPVIPKKVTAGCGATLSAFAYSGLRPSGDYWILIEINESAYGGRPESDGPDSIDELMRNTRNNPIEDLGMHLLSYASATSCGTTCCLARANIVAASASSKCSASSRPDMSCTRPIGTRMSLGVFLVAVPAPLESSNAGTATVLMTLKAGRPKCRRRELWRATASQSIRREAAATGDPLDRPAEQVRDDVLDDFCTVEHARDVYGVVLNSWLELVNEATLARRAELRERAASGDG